MDRVIEKQMSVHTEGLQLRKNQLTTCTIVDKWTGKNRSRRG